MANGQLPLSFPRIMRLPHTLLMPATTSAATLIPRPVRLFREEKGDFNMHNAKEITNKVHRM